MVIWIMGLAGSGKTTLACSLHNILKGSIYLDGDEMRDIFNNFNYDKKARIEVARQKMILGNLLCKQGFNVICTAISLFEQTYTFNRNLCQNYIEIYLKCDIQELIRRDQKGLYSKAKENIVGIDIKVDDPNAHLTLDSSKFSNLEENLETILKFLNKNN